MEWLGRARIKFTHAQTTVKLKAKDGTSTDLLRICEESTPPCHLNPLLFNGDLQTMWTAVKSDGPPVFYKRKVFDADDLAYEGTFAVDFVVNPYMESDSCLPPRTTYFSDDEFNSFGSLDSRPMLVTLHGLSGGSYEVYLRHVLAPLIGKDGGWEACVVNSRGCAKHKITSSILFNARATWDVRQTIKWLRMTFPNRPLFGIGFSLGANILTNVSFHFKISVWWTLLSVHIAIFAIEMKMTRHQREAAEDIARDEDARADTDFSTLAKKDPLAY
jgi:uncharacterized protein